MDIKEKINKIRHNFIDYLLLFIALIAIYGAGIYYLYALNWLSVILILILVATSFFFLDKPLFNKLDSSKLDSDKLSPDKLNPLERKNNYIKYWPYLIYLFFVGICFYILYLSRSERALISPWQVIKPSFFIFYGLGSLTLIFTLLKTNISSTVKIISLSIHYFLNFSIALIVYKIGYGFDPFIHQATMELIDKKGFVSPKPLYYLGEYGIIVFLHKFSGLSIYALNKFLVPVLAAIFLPIASYRLTNKNSSKNSRILSSLFILTLSFAPFIISTPQNLSYLFLILTILFGLTKTNLLWSLILALATAAIHPLTGIPALSWFLILLLKKYSNKFKLSTRKIWKVIIFLISSLALPLALFISGGSDIKKINWNLNLIIEPFQALFKSLNTAGQENWLLNFVYFFGYNYNLFLVLIIIISLIAFYRQKDRQNFKNLIFINLALSVAYLVSSQIIFNDLISYEQSNFSARLLILITIFFIPIIILELQKLIELILIKDKLSKLIFLFFGLSLLTSSLYISYPRYDKYFNSRGYSTSANDLLAVELIEKEAKGPYLVLANQQVSVAALKKLGFDNYFKTPTGQIFFYPIPTGGPLYEYYLEMVYKKPSRKTMASARALTGVKESYLIINKYWYESGKIINEAKITADTWQEVNGEVYIFKYLEN